MCWRIALDLDGTIYQGATVFPQSKPFLSALSELGVGYSFILSDDDPADEPDAVVVGVLVLTGETTADQVAACEDQPDIIVEDLGDLEHLLRQCQQEIQS